MNTKAKPTTMTLPTSEAQALEEPLLPSGDAVNDDESPVELASDPSEIVVHQGASDRDTTREKKR